MFDEEAIASLRFTSPCAFQSRNTDGFSGSYLFSNKSFPELYTVSCGDMMSSSRAANAKNGFTVDPGVKSPDILLYKP